jgi:opacity protein-like surface antigen
VYGLEAAWSWVDASDTTFPRGTVGSNASNSITYRAKDYGSLKARAGLALGDTLVYVAAGPAWGRFNLAASCCFIPGFSPISAASASTTKLGLVGAFGIEHMLTPSWIIRGQFEFAQFDTQRGVIIPLVFGATREVGQDTSIMSATVGVSYKFGWR